MKTFLWRIENRTEHKIMKYNYFLVLIGALALLLSGCDGDVWSKKPILGPGDSSALDDAPGYWARYWRKKTCEADGSISIKDADSGGKNEVEDIAVIEDLSTEADHVYKLKKMDGHVEYILKGRGSKNGYALQICRQDKELVCTYVHATKVGDEYQVFELDDTTLSAHIKNLLGDLYTEYEEDDDDSNIELPDDFVAKHGKELITLIANTTLTKPSSCEGYKSEFFFYSLKKISEKQAKKLISSKSKKTR
jgi:hypothetical protein